MEFLTSLAGGMTAAERNQVIHGDQTLRSETSWKRFAGWGLARKSLVGDQCSRPSIHHPCWWCDSHTPGAFLPTTTEKQKQRAAGSVSVLHRKNERASARMSVRYSQRQNGRQGAPLADRSPAAAHTDAAAPIRQSPSPIVAVT